MKTFLNHLQLNIDTKNIPFYKNLMTHLGWKNVLDEPNMTGFSDGQNGSLWFLPKQKQTTNDYDGPGVNHIGIGASSMSDVDAVAKFLKDNGITLLFGTPKKRPEFSGPKGVYYQVMFESPDRILFEIVYSEKTHE